MLHCATEAICYVLGCRVDILLFIYALPSLNSWIQTMYSATALLKWNVQTNILPFCQLSHVLLFHFACQTSSRSTTSSQIRKNITCRKKKVDKRVLQNQIVGSEASSVVRREVHAGHQLRSSACCNKINNSSVASRYENLLDVHLIVCIWFSNCFGFFKRVK